jgi:hypothetical protein
MGILAALSVLTVIFGTYCATRNSDLLNDFKTSAINRPDSPRLHFITRRELLELEELESHHVLFRLQSSQPIKEHARNSPGSLGITVEELGRCIPWIPYNSKIFIYVPEGFRRSLLNDIGKLRTKRDLFLIRELPDNVGSTKRSETRI